MRFFVRRLASASMALAWAFGGAQLPCAEAPRPGFHPLGGPAPSPRCAVAYELLLAGDLVKAEKELSLAVAEKPSDSAAHFGLGLLRQLGGWHQKALEHFRDALQTGGGEPWGELCLRAIAQQLRRCRDPEPFLAAIRALRDDLRVPGSLKDLALQFHTSWLLRQGQFEAAAKTSALLPFVTRWALIGPFDNRDKSGLDKPYGPEEELDLERPCPGRNRQVSWFRPGAEPVDGVVKLEEVFEPNTHSLAYALTHVQAPQNQWAVLWVGAAGAVRAWVNEREVLKLAEYNDFAHGKAAVPVYLHKGWNRVLVKSAAGEEAEWAFAVRFSGLEGGPVAGLKADSSAEALESYRAESAGRSTPLLEPPNPQLGLLPRLRAALKSSPDDPWLRWAHGFLLHQLNLGQRQERLAAAEYLKAVEGCPRCPLFRVSLADVPGDVNQARKALEAARRELPELPGAYEGLAELAYGSGFAVEAEQHARDWLLKHGPERANFCAFILADILEDRGQLAEAESLAKAYVAGCPFQPLGWLLLSRLRPSRQQRRETLKEALASCGGNGLLRQQYAAELRELGKEREAAELLEAGAAAGPFAIHNWLVAAEAWRLAGQPQREKAMLDKGRGMAPESPAVLTALGAQALSSGDPAQAGALWREVLRVKPDSPNVKDWLSEIAAGGAVDKGFFEAYDVSYRDLPQPKDSDYPNDHSVTLLNQEVVHVNPNGSASRMTHLVAKLLRPDGLEGLRRRQVYYDPQRQVVDILRAAVITPGGAEMSRAAISDRTVSAALGVQTRIYDEYHVKEIVFRDLEPGALLDLQYTIRDTGGGIYGDYFADIFVLGDDQPVKKSQYTLDLPKAREFQMRAYRMGLQPKPLASADPNRKVFRWESEDLPGVARERLMPPLADELPFVQVTTMKTWHEVGAWYWNLSRESLAAEEELRRTVAEITAQAQTPTDKLRAIHDWVIKKIRYLAIAFGRSGYKPHRAADTLKALYGDCKDTAALLAAMLQAVGLDSRLVLVRTLNAGRIESDALPAPNLFNHCILYVPDVEGQEYWIDGTTDYHRLGEMPYANQGAQALLVGPDGGRFVRIPPATAAENRNEYRIQAQVDKTGAGTLLMRALYRGQFAPSLREMAETPGRFKSMLQEQAARRFPGAELARLNHAAPGEQGPMWVESEFRVPTLAALSGDRRALASAPEPLDLSRRYLTGGQRRRDLEMLFPWARSSEVIYHLDPAWRAAGLPEETDLKEDFGSFRRQVLLQDQMVRIVDELVLSSQRITTEQYAKFSDFCHRVDALLEQKVLLEGR